MTEHEIAQKAFSNNRERLKAERLAREAAGTTVAKRIFFMVSSSLFGDRVQIASADERFLR